MSGEKSGKVQAISTLRISGNPVVSIFLTCETEFVLFLAVLENSILPMG